MRYTTLKKTNLRISRIGLGTNAVGGHNLFENINEEAGKKFVEAALEEGITFLDTADIYGKGRSEELIGQVISGRPRNEIVLATKGSQNWQTADGSVQTDNSPAYLRQAFEASLKRLQTDYIDLYYIHFPDGKTPIGEAVAELVKWKEEGKIRAIGVSNLSFEQLQEANVHGDINALQMPYHLLDRSVEKDILPYCVENDISFIPYGPLAFGLLGGKYTKEFTLAPNDWRRSVSLFSSDEFENSLAKVEQLKKVAANKNSTVSHLSLAWLLSQNGVDSVIPGGKHPEQIRDTAKASRLLLTAEDLSQIDDILS